MLKCQLWWECLLGHIALLLLKFRIQFLLPTKWIFNKSCTVKYLMTVFKSASCQDSSRTTRYPWAAYKEALVGPSEGSLGRPPALVGFSPTTSQATQLRPYCPARAYSMSLRMNSKLVYPQNHVLYIKCPASCLIRNDVISQSMRLHCILFHSAS